MCRVPWAYLRWSYRLWREEESPQLGLLQLSKGRFDGLLRWPAVLAKEVLRA